MAYYIEGRYLNACEQGFVEILKYDIENFLENICAERCVLVFPPFLSKFRYISHQFVKDYFPALTSFSVGFEEQRRLVLGYTAFVNSCCMPYRCVHEKLINISKVENNNLVCACYSELSSKKVKSKEPSVKSQINMKTEKMNVDDSHEEKTLSPKRISLRDKSKRPDKQIYIPRALRGSKNKDSLEKNYEANIVKKKSISDIELLDPCMKYDSMNLDEKGDNLNLLIDNSETVLSNTKQLVKETSMPMLTSNVVLQNTDNHTEDSYIDTDSSKTPRTNDSCASSSSMTLNSSSEGETSINFYKESTEDLSAFSSSNESKCPSTADVSNTKPVTVKKDESTDQESWESMFDDDGECLNPDVLKELSAVVGRVKIKVSEKNYSEYQPVSESNSEFDGIVELHDFPKEFNTQDLVSALSFFQQSSYTIKWVDDCHALALFSSPAMANQALQLKHCFVKIRPLSEGIKESKAKAKWLIKEPEASKPRPTTSAALARRLVSGALGLKVQTNREIRERERSILKEAKEKRKQEAKQRQDVWEGVV